MDDVLLSLSQSNTSTVIALSNGVYLLSATSINLQGSITFVGGLPQTPLQRRDQRQRPDHKLASIAATPGQSVIVAAPDTRHFLFSNGYLQTDQILFAGNASAKYSGGIEIAGIVARATFSRTDFRDCKWYTQGGALAITDGAAVSLGR